MWRVKFAINIKMCSGAIRGCSCLNCTILLCWCILLCWEVCQNSLILKKSQSPDFHKPGLCYV